MNRSPQQLRELLRQFVETDIGGKKLRGFAYERLRIEQNNESKPRDVLSGHRRHFPITRTKRSSDLGVFLDSFCKFSKQAGDMIAGCNLSATGSPSDQDCRFHRKISFHEASSIYQLP